MVKLALAFCMLYSWNFAVEEDEAHLQMFQDVLLPVENSVADK